MQSVSCAPQPDAPAARPHCAVLLPPCSRDGSATFDFTGTGPEVYGNLNAPPAVAYSAIIYSLRCMVTRDIPLNQGCLAPIKVCVCVCLGGGSPNTESVLTPIAAAAAAARRWSSRSSACSIPRQRLLWSAATC
jgi:N-methylhydantoinase B/oxoprolinase/acetone carboxylase alpha subunit